MAVWTRGGPEAPMEATADPPAGQARRNALRRAPTVVAGRYEVDLDRPLGSGGMALVYHGRDLRTRREVALKTLRTEYRGNPDSRARFRHETRLQAFVAHPNVARVFDLQEDLDCPWAVQEYVPGRTLKELLAERGPFAPVEVATLLDQAAGALDHLHARNLVHLDVKPQNLLLTPTGTLKLIDFGLAQSAGGTQELIGGTTFGTAAYLAPEQACGDPVEPATDIYALGCVVYELLTGRPPFESETPGEVKNEVIRAHLERPPLPPSRLQPDLGLPASLDDVVLWALAKRPADRYREAGAFARLFRATLDEKAGPGPGTTTPVALVDVPTSPPPARYFRALDLDPPAGGTPARLSGRLYRGGGRAARRARRLRRMLWRLVVIVALGNAVLGMVLLWQGGTDALLPGGPRLRSGGHARVTEDGTRLRAAPGTGATTVTTLDRGDPLAVTGGATEADGLTWWPVVVQRQSEDLTGYVWAGGLEPTPKRPAWLETADRRLERATDPIHGFVEQVSRLQP